MRLKELLTGICLLLAMTYYSQGFCQNTNEKLKASLSFGIGQMYGMIGVRSVIGFNNAGLTLGLGYWNKHVAFSAGGQVAVGKYFFNMAYSQAYLSDKYIGTANLIGGTRIDLKKIFIEVGLGISFGKNYYDPPRVKCRYYPGIMIGVGLKQFKKTI